MRDGINVARFAMKLKSLNEGRGAIDDQLRIAIIETLGDEALRYVPRL